MENKNITSIRDRFFLNNVSNFFRKEKINQIKLKSFSCPTTQHYQRFVSSSKLVLLLKILIQNHRKVHRMFFVMMVPDMNRRRYQIKIDILRHTIIYH